VLEYVDHWFQLQSMPAGISWLKLSSKTVYYRSDVLPLAEKIAPEIAAKDELFDEISQLNGILMNIPDDLFYEMSTEQKWARIFNVSMESVGLKNLYRIISAIFSVNTYSNFLFLLFLFLRSLSQMHSWNGSFHWRMFNGQRNEIRLRSNR
jgi:hypothetical protein